MEEVKKKEEIKRVDQIEQTKIINARAYYQRSLMIKYVMVPLAKLVE